MKTKLLVLAVLGVACAMPQANADTLYTTFGAGDSYDANAWGVSGSSSQFGENDFAASFTVASDATFTGLRVAVQLFDGTDSVTVQLRGDSSGSPGSVLESFTLSGLTSSAAIYSLTSSLNPVLSANSTYWIALLPGGATTFAGWNNSSTVLSSTIASATDGGSSWLVGTGSISPAFDVSGTLTAVPEPSSALLLLGGLGALGLYRRRKA